MVESSRPRAIAIATGAGGLALGTHRAGFHLLAAVEPERAAGAILAANVAALTRRSETAPTIVTGATALDALDRLRASRLGPVELVVGSARAPLGASGGADGSDAATDDRLAALAECIRRTGATAFIVETIETGADTGRDGGRYVALCLAVPSVPRLIGESVASHLARLRIAEAAGAAWSGDGARYAVRSRMLNAADYGVPQSRRRRVYVGFRVDRDIRWRFPDPTHGRDILAYEMAVGTYWQRHDLPAPIGDRVIARTAPLPLLADHHRPRPWRTVRDAIHDLPAPTDPRAEAIRHQLVGGARAYPGHTGSALDAPAKTLKSAGHGIAGGENTLHAETGELRYLTVREAARLHRFPDSWRLDGTWAAMMGQLGASMPPRLAFILARSIADAIPRGDRARS